MAVAFVVGLYWSNNEGRTISSSLPPHPETGSLPAAFYDHLETVEERLRFPWNDHTESVLELAGLYQINGFVDEALVCYELALNGQNSQNAVALYRRAELASQMGELENTRDYLLQSVELRPDYIPSQLKLAEANYKLGNANQAIERYRSILQVHESQPQALFALARYQLQENRVDESITTLKKLVLSNPSFSEGYAILSQALERQGQDELAAEVREKAPRRKALPLEDPWLDSLLADCFDSQRLSFEFENYLKAGALDRALELVDRMEAIRPKDPQAHQQRGYAYYQMGQYADAAGSYDRALDLGGAQSTIRYFLADSLAKAGAKEKAVSVVRDEIADTGGDADMLVLLADLTKDDGTAEQIELFERALEKDSYHLQANRELSELYWELGKRRESIELLENVRQLLTQDLASRVMIGRYALELNQPDQAVEPLREAVNLDPKNQDASALLALACLRLGNEKARAGAFDLALSFYDQAIDVSADGEEAYLNKVRLCLKLERYDLAESTVAELIERRPDDPVLYVSLGDVRMASGNRDGAEASWQEALSRTEGNLQLRQAIERRLKGDG